jgi:hypothetical protein
VCGGLAAARGLLFATRAHAVTQLDRSSKRGAAPELSYTAQACMSSL